MAEKEIKPEVWKELQQKERTRELVFKTAYGDAKFVVRLLGWMELEGIRDQCSIIDITTQQYHFDQPKYALLRLKASLVEHPFPKEQLDALLPTLDTIYYTPLSKALEEMQNEATKTAKNS
jgi:hypothetical protein